MNQKRNEGITLIALVITIIVLLILAGVTISMVLGGQIHQLHVAGSGADVHLSPITKNQQQNSMLRTNKRLFS